MDFNKPGILYSLLILALVQVRKNEPTNCFDCLLISTLPVEGLYVQCMHVGYMYQDVITQRVAKFKSLPISIHDM